MFLFEWPGGSWETSAALVGAVLAIYVALFWIALVFWTVRDIHQRTNNSTTQLAAGLLVLAFFLPGHWLYLILRPRITLAERYERSLEAEAVLHELADRTNCPACAKRVREDYIRCPSCKVQLKEPCKGCQRPLKFAWLVCPFCGVDAERAPVPMGVLVGPATTRRKHAKPVETKSPEVAAIQRSPKPFPRPVRTVEEQSAPQLSGGAPGR